MIIYRVIVCNSIVFIFLYHQGNKNKDMAIGLE